MFKRNEKKYRKDTLKLKMPFAARFSFCSTIDFNSILGLAVFTPTQPVNTGSAMLQVVLGVR